MPRELHHGLLGLLVGCVVFSGCQSASTGESMDTEEPVSVAEPAPPPSSVIQLFNGENLDGWENVNDGQFSVEDGALKVNRGSGWLRSNDTFGDFVLTMEFRFLEEGANSGIFVRTPPESTDDERGWPVNGYQVQCRDAVEDGTPLAHMIAVGEVSIETESDLEALRQAYKPAGEWHTYEIRAEGENLSVTLNGVLITTATGVGNLSGHIGIQGEDGLLEFRRVDVEEI